MHKEIALYERVSTAEQAHRGQSLETQEKILTDYAAMRWPAAATRRYVDVASGRGVRRPRYQAMLLDCKRGHIAVVCATEMSRLWRSTHDATIDSDRMKIWGVELMIWNLGLDSTTACGRLTFGFMSLLAAFESDQISERVKRTHNVRQAAGLKGPGRRPYGWRVDDSGRLARDEREQGAIDLVYAMRSKGSSWLDCASYLTTAGLRTVEGKSWDAGGLRLVTASVQARRAREARTE